MTLTRTNYFDDPRISASMLKELDRSPFHYHSRFVAKTTPDKSTDALRKGRAIHAMLFEPETFGARFPVFEGDKKTSEAKARFADLDNESALLDGCVIRASEVADLDGMAAALRADRRVANLLSSLSHPEFPLAFADPMTGVECKARLDALACDGRVIIDLKSTTDARDRELSRTIANYGYHLQGSHYEIGVEAHFGKTPEAFVLIFVESAAPYAVNVRTLSRAALDKGRAKRAGLLTTLTECRESGRWPAFGETIEDIDLPSWAA